MKEISITSFENLKIGQAENSVAGTGCTVFLLGKNGAPAGLDVRGGGPAFRGKDIDSFRLPVKVNCFTHSQLHKPSMPLCWPEAAHLD